MSETTSLSIMPRSEKPAMVSRKCFSSYGLVTGLNIEMVAACPISYQQASINPCVSFSDYFPAPFIPNKAVVLSLLFQAFSFSFHQVNAR